jgi:phosphoribosylanthranilate isomerase
MSVASFVPRIKFCGITSLDDARRAVAAGAWAVGLIMWPGSPRACQPEAAARIGAALRRQVEVVGVFVNPELDQLADAAEGIGLTILQLHGDEGPAFCAEAARRTGCRVIKAVRVSSGADIQALSAFHTDFHLLDSHVPGARGGTGETFAWELAGAHRGRVPVILSGGLTPANVAEAVATVRPFAVDVASGIEAAPGRKDPAKLVAFAAALGASATVQPPRPDAASAAHASSR